MNSQKDAEKQGTGKSSLIIDEVQTTSYDPITEHSIWMENK